jgi:RNA polymerase sigma factor (sigma-70 family)
MLTALTIQNISLFTRFKNGDQNAFTLMYEDMYPTVYRYGYRIVEDSFLIDTLVQEAFEKLWNLRHRITSMLHALRFLRLMVRWGCVNYFRQPQTRFQRSIVYLDVWDANMAFCSADDDPGPESFSEEQVQAVYNVIPYLPPGRQTIVQLHFRYGFSLKQIAGRFGTTNHRMQVEVQKCVLRLKSIIRASGKLPAGHAVVHGILTGMHEQVYTLRITKRYTITRIAEEMGLSPAETLSIYTKAAKLIRQQQLANAN